MNCSPVKNRTVIIPHSGSHLGWGESRGRGEDSGDIVEKLFRSTCQLIL